MYNSFPMSETSLLPREKRVPSGVNTGEIRCSRILKGIHSKEMGR